MWNRGKIWKMSLATARNPSAVGQTLKMATSKANTSKIAKSKMATSTTVDDKGDKRRKVNHSGSGVYDLDYFHYYIPREEIDPMLQKEGDFMVREGVLADKRAAVILSLRTKDGVKHFPAEINSDDNMFYFTTGVGMTNLVDLVEYHFQKKVPVRGEVLKCPVKRTAWEILKQHVQFEENVLGEGNFAVVKRGKLLVGKDWVDVACKRLKLDRCKTKADADNAKFLILREFQIGRALQGHKYILKIYGIFIASEDLAVIMELCMGGALDKYVEVNQTSNLEKIQFLANAADGLSHMHKLNLIHRDVASRNFLLVKRPRMLPIVKVADFGLTRPGPAYKMGSDQEVPYLISALECLGENPVWTTKSDCWSFGVFMWHMFESCKVEPYNNMGVVNGDALRDMLFAGTRLKPSESMPAALKILMNKCFNADPKKRPEMSEIAARLQQRLRRARRRVKKKKKTTKKATKPTKNAPKTTKKK